MVREEQERHFFSFLFLLKDITPFLKGLWSSPFWSFQNLFVHYKSQYSVPVLPKTGLVFPSLSAQACLATGSQSGKTCPSIPQHPVGISRALLCSHSTAQRMGQSTRSAKLTLPVTDLFNRDFLLTAREDWQVYYSGLNIMIFISVRFSYILTAFSISWDGE